MRFKKCMAVVLAAAMVAAVAAPVSAQWRKFRTKWRNKPNGTESHQICIRIVSACFPCRLSGAGSRPFCVKSSSFFKSVSCSPDASIYLMNCFSWMLIDSEHLNSSHSFSIKLLSNFSTLGFPQKPLLLCSSVSSASFSM